MIKTHFSPISLSDLPAYQECFSQTPRRASDYTFTNVWGWAEHYALEWRFEHDLCWIRQAVPTEQYWAPVGNWHNVDWLSCACIQKGMTFIRVPEELIVIWQQIFGERVTVEETPGQWDYIYASQELAELKGNKFHRKKNHVNRFVKTYGLDYRPLTPDCIESVIEMQEQWCQWRECEESESLLAENEAVIRVLEAWDSIPRLCGGSLYVDGSMAAYTVGEPLDDTTLVVHFEKGHSSYNGIYQAINTYFIRNEGAPFAWINREQDVGDEGSQKAKQSYYPIDFLRKNTVHIAPA